MNIPYNNGKVCIGKYYQKPLYIEEDSDMLTIQGWLIGDNKTARRNRIANISYVMLLGCALILAVLT